MYEAGLDFLVQDQLAYAVALASHFKTHHPSAACQDRWLTPFLCGLLCFLGKLSLFGGMRVFSSGGTSLCGEGTSQKRTLPRLVESIRTCGVGPPSQTNAPVSVAVMYHGRRPQSVWGEAISLSSEDPEDAFYKYLLYPVQCSHPWQQVLGNLLA